MYQYVFKRVVLSCIMWTGGDNMELYSVKEVADLVNVHEKTIRRYINNGKLDAKKIGGQWRVEKDSLDKLLNPASCCQDSIREEEMTSSDFCVFMDTDFFASSDKLQICSIVDFYSEDMDLINDVLNKLKSLAYDYLSKGKRVKVEYIYSDDDKKARFVFWGKSKEIEQFMKIVSVLEKNQVV